MPAPEKVETTKFKTTIDKNIQERMRERERERERAKEGGRQERKNESVYSARPLVRMCRGEKKLLVLTDKRTNR